MSIVDIKTGKIIDPPAVTQFVSYKDYQGLLKAHNDLVDAHNGLVHKCALLELEIEKLSKPRRRWFFL